jgi:hypothetical protein
MDVRDLEEYQGESSCTGLGWVDVSPLVSYWTDVVRDSNDVLENLAQLHLPARSFGSFDVPGMAGPELQTVSINVRQLSHEGRPPTFAQLWQGQLQALNVGLERIAEWLTTLS